MSTETLRKLVGIIKKGKNVREIYPLPVVKDGKQWVVYLNKDLIADLKEEAKKEEKNINQFLNQILGEYILKKRSKEEN